MKILRLELTDWRRFRGGPHELSFHERGMVLSGPNETGKSTIFDAVRRALFDRSKTNASWVGRIVPYHLKGALPTVRLEFEHEGRTWSIRKSFGGKGGAELSEFQKGKWTALAKNEEAEEMLLDLLGAEASSKRDGTPPSSWGAFQWLFVPQHLRSLPGEGSDAAAKIGLDQAGVSPEFDEVWSRVLEEYGKSFGKKATFLKSSEVRRLESQIAGLSTQRDELAGEIRNLDEMRREYEDIQESLPQLRKDAGDAHGEWDEVQEEVVDLSGAQGNLQAAEADRERRKTEAKQASSVLKERLRREKEAESAKKARGKTDDDRALTAVVLIRIRERLEAARTETVRVGDRVAGLRRRNADATNCLRIREGKSRSEAVRKRLGKARELDGRIRVARTSLGGEPPGLKTIREVEQRVGEIRAKRLSLRSAALQVSVEGDPDFQVRIDGEPLEGKEGVALKEVVVEAIGGGKVRVEGSTQEAQRLADEASSMEREVEEFLAPFGVGDLEGLRDLREKRLEQKSRIESLENARRTLDDRPTDEIEKELATLTGEIEDLEARRSAQDPDPEHDAMAEAELKALVDRLGEKTGELEPKFEEARGARKRLAGEQEKTEREAREAAEANVVAQTREAGASRELDHHRDQFGSTGNCKAREEEGRKALETAQAHVKACREDLARLEKDAVSRRETAKKRVGTLDERVFSQEARADQLMDALERESARGAYSRMADLEREIESEDRRLARLQKEANAVSLLKTLMEAVRSAAVNRVVAPIKEDLDELLAYATRGRYRLANLTDALIPSELDGLESCRFEDGSQGLRELVTTLIRLSVASHLSKTEPQALILDDPCVHVSRERTRRLVEILNRISGKGRIQAIVLTHRENEFAGLEGGMVDVGTLKPSSG